MAGTVLCVDDDRNLNQILSKALGAEGYDVHTASDGDTAIDLVREIAPDIVLLDLIMPRRDGFAVMEAIRAADGPASATPVLILSGCTPTPAYRVRAAELGAVDLFTKPVPLATLSEAIARVISKGRPSAAQAAPEKTKRPSGAVAQGSLARVPFPALLHHLHGLRATGILHLAAGKKRKWVQLRDGHPVAVRSNLIHECLGHYLVRTGRIGPKELEECQKQMDGGRLQGEILVAMELLDEEEIAAALRAQADEKFFEIFAWKDGSFRFEKGATLARSNAFGVKRSPANLILRGVCTRFPGERIEAFLRAAGDRAVLPGNSPYYRFQEVELTPEQDAVLRDQAGGRRVRDIVASDPDQSLGRALYAMVATGLLELHGDVTVTQLDQAAPNAPTRATANPPSNVAPAAPPAGATPRTQPGAAAKTASSTTPRRGGTPQDKAERSSLEAMARRFSAQTHFEILGVEPTATDEEVEAAYVSLAERSHPDRYADASDAVREVAEEVFAHITRAYDTLRDPRSRSEYLLDVKREERAAAQAEKGEKALEAANRFKRGEALLHSRSYEDALAEFGRALELNPKEGDYHTHYGWTLHLCHPTDTGMLSEAMEHVRRGLKLASHADRAYLFMGRLFRAIGKPEAAERMFTRAVQIEPDCVEALRELRLINMRRERSKGLIRRMLRR